MKLIFSELNSTVPDENISSIVMFPVGQHTIQPLREDGKDEEITVMVDENAFTNLKATFEENRDKELTLDYNHQGLGGEIAGWVKNLEWDSTKGVVGIVKWGKVTAEKIREGVIKYFSPAFYVDEMSGVIKGFEVPVLGGLTNNPAFAELKNNPIRAQRTNTMEEIKVETAKADETTTTTLTTATTTPPPVVQAEKGPPVETPTHEKQETPQEEAKEKETGKEVGAEKEEKPEKKEELYEAVKPAPEAKVNYAEIDSYMAAYAETKLPGIIGEIVKKCLSAQASVVKAEKTQDGPTRVERKLKTEVLGTVIRAQADELTGRTNAMTSDDVSTKRNLMVQALQSSGMDFQKAWRTIQTTNPELF